MATTKKPTATTIEVSARRTGKTTRQKAAIEKANAEGHTVTVRSMAGDTVHAPGKKPRAAPRTKAATPAAKKAAKKAPAKKTAGKGGAHGNGKTVPRVKKAAAPKDAVAAKMGRPTLYRPELVDMLIAYFDVQVDRIEVVSVPTPDGKGVMPQNEVVQNTFPTLTRFAHNHNLTRQTLYEWGTAINKDGSPKYPDFSYAYVRAREAQESLIVEGGMAGKYESRFAGLAAKNLIGWKDQIETKVDSHVTTATPEELNDFFEAAFAKAAAKAPNIAGRAKRLGVE